MNLKDPITPSNVPSRRKPSVEDRVYTVATDKTINQVMTEYRKRKQAKSMPSSSRQKPQQVGKASTNPIDREIEEQQRSSIMKVCLRVDYTPHCKTSKSFTCFSRYLALNLLARRRGRVISSFITWRDIHTPRHSANHFVGMYSFYLLFFCGTIIFWQAASVLRQSQFNQERPRFFAEKLSIGCHFLHKCMLSGSYISEKKINSILNQTFPVRWHNSLFSAPHLPFQGQTWHFTACKYLVVNGE